MILSDYIINFDYRKLKAAKEKLRRLQDLVSIVQQSPDAVLDLPENLSPNLDDDVAVAQITRPTEQNVAAGGGEITDQAKTRYTGVIFIRLYNKIKNL